MNKIKILLKFLAMMAAVVIGVGYTLKYSIIGHLYLIHMWAALVGPDYSAFLGHPAFALGLPLASAIGVVYWPLSWLINYTCNLFLKGVNNDLPKT